MSNKVSKQLSFILRHNPESANITLDKNGYAKIEPLLDFLKIDLKTLEQIVATNDKQRFNFNFDKTKVRASQGHTVSIDLNLKEIKPITFLYHGTAEQYKDIILKDGIKKMKRHHVHLASEYNDSVVVGMRKGSAVILEIDAPQMVRDGYKFYISENGVYLIDYVPPKYIKVLNQK